MTVTVDPGVEPETTWDGKEALVVDPVAGFRPRRSSTQRMPMAALDGVAPEEIVKRRDAHGFLRDDELPATLERPSVLVVGDSHVDGVVNTAENFTALLEARLTAAGASCHVLNDGCGLYGLWQSVLRACDLLPLWRPKLVVVVVFLGNDFLDLENPTVPHLDDALHELAGGERTGPETTSARERELALPELFSQLFWQGLNQAAYLHRAPERIDALARKAGHAVETIETAAAAQGARVLWVLLPSFDLVFPDKVAGLGGRIQETVGSGAQRRMRDAFAAVLASLAVVDLEPAFLADGTLGLYAIDFHVFRRGHQRMAEALEAPIRDAVTR
ncbi:MAG: SGNH/GDSL hydrolase family protein [Planctomycetes bacterium]|nr:SGNH/GDSL hydrolase family protein [Planctomycetota bacterium]